MSDRVQELLVKAVRLLPPEEQDEVLGGLLLGGITAPAAAVPATGLVAGRQLIGGPDVWMFPTDLPPDEQREAVDAMDQKLKVLPVRLPETDYERLRGFAADQGFSMAVVIRTLVERFLKQSNVPPLP